MITGKYKEEQKERELQEEKERDRIQFEKELKERMNKKNQKIFGVGSKFTKPKKKRK